MGPIAGQSRRQMHERSILLISGVYELQLGTKWHYFETTRSGRLTGQPKLTAIVQSRRLTFSGHIVQMDIDADAKIEDPVNSSSRGLETTRMSPHHMAEHNTAGSEIPQSHTA